MNFPKNVAYGLWCFGVSVALGIPTTIIFAFIAPAEVPRTAIVLSGGISMLLLAILGNFMLLSPLSPNPVILYIRWVQVVVGMLAVIYLFTPSANAWFKNPTNAL